MRVALTLTARHQDEFKLMTDDDVGVAANWAGEARVRRGVQRVTAVLRDIKHAGAEILRMERS